MATIIESDGKAYLVEGGRVIAAADSKDALIEKTAKTASVEEPRGFEVGDRIEVAGRIGTIRTIVTSVYGDVAGIKLDNGSIEEVLTDALKHSAVEEPTYESEVEELAAEFDAYEAMIVAGLDDVRTKAKKARALNLRAKALTTDPKLAFSARVAADRIVITTSVDIKTLKDDEQVLAAAEENYLENQVRYELSADIVSGPSHHREDASWLLDSEASYSEDLAATDWDAFLASEAVGLVGRISDVLIEDEEYVSDSMKETFTTLASGLEGDEFEARQNQFDFFVESERTARVAKIAKQTSERTAAAEEDDTPFEALFI